MPARPNSGRKRIPKEIKKAKGTLNVSREFADALELNSLQALPAAPETLGERGRGIWLRNCQTLIDINMLNVVDLELLEAYCFEWERYFQAVERINAKGVLKGERISPDWRIKNEALKNAMAITQQFGFSPSARTRITMSQIKKPNPKDALFEL